MKAARRHFQRNRGEGQSSAGLAVNQKDRVEGWLFSQSQDIQEAN